MKDAANSLLWSLPCLMPLYICIRVHLYVCKFVCGQITFVESSLARVCSAIKLTQTQVRCIVTEQPLQNMDQINCCRP